MNAPVTKLAGVSKSYGQGAALVQALQDVSLEIRPGELTLIEGPSGSGKTTLLHVLGLLQRPDTGAVWFGDRRLDDLPESRLPDERAAHVVLIFQGYNLLDALTATDNVAIAGILEARIRRQNEKPRRLGAPSGTCGPRRRRAETQTPVGGPGHRRMVLDAPGLLARFGLGRRADCLPTQLSGGEKQRVAIARALASPGRLVLADEPTANLDWTNAQEVVRCLAALAHEEDRAVVMVSHDSRLEPFADRIVGLLNGQISSDRRQRALVMSNAETPESSPSADHRPSKVSSPTVPCKDAANAVVPNPQSPIPNSQSIIGAHRSTRLAWLCLTILLVLGGIQLGRHLAPRGEPPAEPADGAPAAAGSPYVAAAPALVEPGTQLVALRTERQGRIKSILKRAGDRIRPGEALVLLDDATPKALVEKRKTDLQLAEAHLAQLKAWDRPELRAKTKAGVDSTQVRLDRAERELSRVRKLYDGGAAPESELNAAVEEQRLAAAALEETAQAYAISLAGPVPEEIGVAEARVEQSKAALRMAEAELSLRTIVSPLDGHVLYRHLEPGEVVDPESPEPILSLGNLEDIRLRAEVDEADIQRVFVGQRVVATAAAFGEREFTGRVVHLEPLMGRKTIRTERTTEQQDTKVREVLIELDAGAPMLPIDLQMTVRFLAAT